MENREVVSSYDCDELCDHLIQFDFPQDVIWTIREHRIFGQDFVELTDEEIKELFPEMGIRKKLSRHVLPLRLNPGDRATKASTSAENPVSLTQTASTSDQV